MLITLFVAESLLYSSVMTNNFKLALVKIAEPMHYVTILMVDEYTSLLKRRT